MAFGATPKDSTGIPISSGYTPGQGFQALQGSPMLNTDASSNVSAGVVNADQIQAAIMNGKGFVYSTGLLATATNPSLIMALSVFNPSASGKSIYIYSIKWSTVATNTTVNYRLTTTDPAFANAVTGLNQKPLAGASVANATSAANAATASVAVTGTQHDFILINAQGTYELLTTVNTGILLPSGVANGVVVYGTVTSAAQNWGATIRGIEY